MNTKQYEENEFEIGRTLTQLFNLENVTINPTVNQFEILDLHFTWNTINYSCEIKCRKNTYPSYVLEKTKVIELVNRFKNGNEVRYINYIQSIDSLIIFNLNSRLEKLELQFLKDEPDNNINYVLLDLPNTTAKKGTDIEKYIIYLHFNPHFAKDIIIENYSKRLMAKQINFNYQPINQ